MDRVAPQLLAGELTQYNTITPENGINHLPGRCVQQYKGVVKICYDSFVKAVDTENQRNRVEKAVQDRNKLLEEHRNYHLEVHTTEMRPW